MFKPVSSKVNFAQNEVRVAQFWKENHIFEQSIQQREGASQFTLYDGPPTANGSPGIHHTLSRIFKDVIPRYKAMQGYHVPRKAGWDTHGLPVELEVERELGFTTKSQIEEYGVAQFNARCRKSVLQYITEWEKLTERLGCWIDMEHPYVTCDRDYIESCWGIINQLYYKGLVYQGYRVTPHCPRCGTSLSSHEVALGYRDDAPDPSIHIRFRLSKRNQPHEIQGILQKLGWDVGKAEWIEIPSFLAWTTTPWTLTANVALAVAPEETYALVQARSPEGLSERLILAKALLDKTLGQENWRLLEEFPGKELSGIRYERLYEPESSFVVGRGVWAQENRVVTADFVSMDEGTGIVHIAPAYGQDDYELGHLRDLPVVHTVDLEGNMRPAGKPWDGKFIKEADPLIIDDLKRRDLLYRSEEITHTYPFCWRCGAPLLYYAKMTWYIKTTAKKDELIAGNSKINWYPEYIKYGRFGDWLENNVDWAFSRERYWGTPLNIWQCESHPEHKDCIGSITELGAKPEVNGLGEDFDPHRPFVDQVTFRCSKCEGTMRRVPEVLDAWFDSGAMPVAQWHYLLFEDQGENKAQFDRNRVADYICEAVDQTRGWFYTLHALSTLLFDRPCFKNVICLGHILDAKGEKMSKTRGNVVNPWSILDNQGADALRWYMLTAAPPGNVRRFSPTQVTEVMRRFLSTLWNTYSFFVIYANIDKFNPASEKPPVAGSDLDRWIISELHQLISEITLALDNYDPTGAGRKVEEFVDYLSNWYVRRSRRRFWKSENDTDKLSAYFTLYECLVTLSKLIAPLAPFIAEEIYQNLVRSAYPDAPQSVHLCDFPIADPSKVDDRLVSASRLAMKISSMGRSARSKAGIKVRQPLSRVIIKTRLKAEQEGLECLASQVLEELNVKRIEFISEEEELMNLPLSSIVTEGGYGIAVDTEISEELKEEGLAREIVRCLQNMRRNAGFDIADYIVSYYHADSILSHVIEHLSAYIKQETLSRELVTPVPKLGIYVEKHRINGYEVVMGVRKWIEQPTVTS